MKAYEIVSKRVTERGITIAELARRTNTNPELLRRSLCGDRKLYVEEFIPLCRELDLSIGDFCVSVVA